MVSNCALLFLCLACWPSCLLPLVHTKDLSPGIHSHFTHFFASLHLIFFASVPSSRPFLPPPSCTPTSLLRTTSARLSFPPFVASHLQHIHLPSTPPPSSRVHLTLSYSSPPAHLHPPLPSPFTPFAPRHHHYDHYPGSTSSLSLLPSFLIPPSPSLHACAFACARTCASARAPHKSTFP